MAYNLLSAHLWGSIYLCNVIESQSNMTWITQYKFNN